MSTSTNLNLVDPPNKGGYSVSTTTPERLEDLASDRASLEVPLLFGELSVDDEKISSRPSVQRLSQYRTPFQERKLQLVFNDTLCVLVSLFSAYVIWVAIQPAIGLSDLAAVIGNKWTWAPIGISLWVFSAWLTDLYDVAVIGVKRVVAQRVATASMVSTLIVLTSYFLASDHVPRGYLVIYITLVGAMVVLSRALIYSHTDRNPRQHRVLLLGSEMIANELNQLFENTHRLRHAIVARSDEADLAKTYFESNGQGLLEAVQKHSIDEIVVEDGIASDEVFRLLVQCQSNGVRVSSMPEVYRKLARRIPIRHVNSTWVLRAFQDHILFTRIQLCFKRCVDLAGGLAGLPIFLSTFPLVAIAIKLNSTGPIFYCQERTGRGGKSFWIIKYRTMRTDAESDGKARWSGDNDPRITPVGRFLRKTRLDEVPQILNVLRGDMSLVGPRPERPQIEETLDRDLPHYFIRRLVKPGITGWAQVHYKYGNSLRDSLVKLEYDTYYVRYWSIYMDFYVVFRTVMVVLKGGGQ